MKYEFHFSDIAFVLTPLILGIGSNFAFGKLIKSKPNICNITPRLQPPGWVFGVAWSILYTLLGISAVLLWIKQNRKWSWQMTLALVFLLQLVSWWFIFSTRCAPLMAFLALIWIYVCYIILTIVISQISLTAGMLLIPLLVWLLVASYLSFDIYRISRK